VQFCSLPQTGHVTLGKSLILFMAHPSATRWPGCQWHQTPNRHSALQPRTPEQSTNLSCPSSWDYRCVPPHPTVHSVHVEKLKYIL
uniref:Uncharacterized protein n=1 Tax=Chrysemys picta bellii TaxID=8478 RepID=A0A8C3I098_CHRPI